MKPQTALLAVALILVAALSYLVGHSRPRRAPVTPEEIVAASAEARAVKAVKTRPRPDASGKAKAPAVATSKAKDAPVPIPGIANPPTPHTAKSVPEGTYRNDELGLTIARPGGDAWAMTSQRASFRDPIRHPAKLLEMRREPKDGTSKYAVIELFAIPIPADSSARAETERFERFGGRGEKADCKLLGEGSSTVGGHTLTRRMSSFQWTERKRETRLVSISTVVRDRLVLLLAYADSRHFDAILPEFDMAIQSLEIE